MIGLEFYNGKRVIITNAITKKDVQARRHKKKRINKKWLKRYGHKAVPDNNKVIMTNDTLYMTKKCYEKLKRKCYNDQL